MTETEVVRIETPEEPVEQQAEAIADAIVEAQEEVREELEQEAAVEEAAEVAETALEGLQTHGHSEYAQLDHFHDSGALDARMSALEDRVASVEAGLMEEPEEVVEEIEPTPAPAPEPEKPKRKHRFG